jgi:tRNA U54 and U55 pseudouridine synthase Pus10
MGDRIPKKGQRVSLDDGGSVTIVFWEEEIEQTHDECACAVCHGRITEQHFSYGQTIRKNDQLLKETVYRVCSRCTAQIKTSLEQIYATFSFSTERVYSLDRIERMIDGSFWLYVHPTSTRPN